MAFVLMVVLVAVFFFYLPDKWSNNVENMHAVLCFFFITCMLTHSARLQ